MMFNAARKRPGVYHSITKSQSIYAFIDPPEGSEDDPGGDTKPVILVTPDGVMYSTGPAFSIGGEEGAQILLFADTIDASVSGETMGIRNPSG